MILVYEKYGNKIWYLYFIDRRLLLNGRNEPVYKCRHIGKFKLFWLRATEAPILGNSKNDEEDFIGN